MGALASRSTAVLALQLQNLRVSNFTVDRSVRVVPHLLVNCVYSSFYRLVGPLKVARLFNGEIGA